MTPLEIKPVSAPEADTVTVQPSELLQALKKVVSLVYVLKVDPFLTAMSSKDTVLANKLCLSMPFLNQILHY